MFDANGNVDIVDCSLEVWPGYEGSICQFEAGPSLLIDVTHKVISTRSVYDVMRNIRSLHPPAKFKESCLCEIVGQIIITRLVDLCIIRNVIDKSGVH